MPAEAVPGPGRSGRPIMALFDVLGQRWTLRIMWELHLQSPLTFRALQQSCGGMSSSVLISRLEVLREVRLATLEDGGYRLTTQAERLVDHLLPLVRWSEDWVADLAELTGKSARGMLGTVATVADVQHAAVTTTPEDVPAG